METGSKIVNENGRYRWAFAARDKGELNYFAASLVTFETEAQAAKDLAMHGSAGRDESGRLVFPAEHLNMLVGAAAQEVRECDGWRFAPVYWHQPDEHGCNWGVQIISGAGDSRPCVAATQNVAHSLRMRYNLPAPA